MSAKTCDKCPYYLKRSGYCGFWGNLSLLGVKVKDPLKPPCSAEAIFDVETSELYVGGWGKLVVRVRGLGRASLAVEGDVEWINPGVVELSEDCVVEVPVKPRVGGEVPVKVSVESSGVKTSKIVWLKVADKVRNCTICGAPVEPGAKYCWKCGTKLS
jgi:hypothetical protein